MAIDTQHYSLDRCKNACTWSVCVEFCRGPLTSEEGGRERESYIRCSGWCMSALTSLPFYPALVVKTKQKISKKDKKIAKSPLIIIVTPYSKWSAFIIYVTMPEIMNFFAWWGPQTGERYQLCIFSATPIDHINHTMRESSTHSRPSLYTFFPKPKMFIFHRHSMDSADYGVALLYPVVYTEHGKSIALYTCTF